LSHNFDSRYDILTPDIQIW